MFRSKDETHRPPTNLSLTINHNFCKNICNIQTKSSKCC